MRLLRRWCWSCFAVMWGLYLIGSAAFAQTGGPGGGPGWQDVALGALGIVSLLLGVVQTRNERRQDRVEQKLENTEARISGIREALGREHYTKGEIKEGFQKIERSFAEYREETVEARSLVQQELRALHRRLDIMRVPMVPEREG
jgi:hypothetical protein